MRYADYFPEYSQYFGRALKILKYMYGMTNYGKLISDEMNEWLIEEGFMQSQCQMSIYYNYAPDGSKIVVLSYVDDGVNKPFSNIFICIPVYTIINIR